MQLEPQRPGQPLQRQLHVERAGDRQEHLAAADLDGVPAARNKPALAGHAPSGAADADAALVEYRPVVLVADVNECEFHGRVLSRQLLDQGLDRLRLGVLQRLEDVEYQSQRVIGQPAVAGFDVFDTRFQRAKQLTRVGRIVSFA